MRGKMMIENQDECAERGREKVQGRHAEEREFPISSLHIRLTSATPPVTGCRG